MATTTKEKTTGEEMVTIMIPRPADRMEAPFITASVNGKGYKIKKGEKVEVPASLAEVLENSEKAKEEAYGYSESLNKE